MKIQDGLYRIQDAKTQFQPRFTQDYQQIWLLLFCMISLNNVQIKEVYVRWIGIPIVAFLATVILEHDHEQGIYGEYLISLAFTVLYWNGAYMIFIGLRKVFPSIKQTVQRLLLTSIALSIWMTFGGTPIKLILDTMNLTELFSWMTYKETIGFNLMIGFIVGSLYETAFFFENWKQTIRDNEELKNQQIRMQFEVLSNQMSPHFLFNSLNTLTTLISENQKLATEFTEKLSEVYRYILTNKDRELVTLHEEIEFAKSYLFLLEMRYPENLYASFRITEKYYSMNVAPLTIQMLIENAIKHNTISKANPLYIDIYVENEKSIIVKNNLQKKSVLEKSTKTGLANIKKRYEYLGNRSIDIITTAKNYMVAIPLIAVIEDSETKKSIEP